LGVGPRSKNLCLFSHFGFWKPSFLTLNAPKRGCFPPSELAEAIPITWRVDIAKNQNTFAKRQREMEKRMKAEEKRQRRIDRKENPPVIPASDSESDAEVESS